MVTEFTELRHRADPGGQQVGEPSQANPREEIEGLGLDLLTTRYSIHHEMGIGLEPEVG
jgi:hypothetical protein